jgi:peptidoglycan/xylan/chitin deacetylase (PgdA/CDA1 family)
LEDKFKFERIFNHYRILFGVPIHKLIKFDSKNFILLYHGLSDTHKNKYNSRHLYFKDFEKQIRYLKTKANLISINDFFNEKFDKNKSNIAITFDDAYKNNFKYLLPLVEEYQFPVSIYSTLLHKTNHPYIWADFFQICQHHFDKSIVLDNKQFINKNNMYVDKEGKSLIDYIKNNNSSYELKKQFYSLFEEDFLMLKDSNMYWQLMDDDELIKISKSKFVTIGSHGNLHNNLGQIDIENAKNELIESNLYLENLLQKKIDELAYPDGSYNNELLDYAYKMGFKYQLAAEGFLNKADNDIFFIRDRIGIYQCGKWTNQLINL